MCLTGLVVLLETQHCIQIKKYLTIFFTILRSKFMEVADYTAEIYGPVIHFSMLRC